MNSALDFFKNGIKDNNYDGIQLAKNINIIRSDNIFNTKQNFNESRIKDGIFIFVESLYFFISTQNINHYINQITFDEEFDANVEQKIFDIFGNNFDNLKIHTGNIVGSIVYKSKPFNINCRFGNEFLQYMIASSSGFLELENLGNINKDIGLGEWILIYYWKIQLKKAFALGMYKTYQEKSDNCSSVRGSININKYLKKTFFDGKVDCKYKEHSYNNIINGVISLALKKVFKGKYLTIVTDIYEIKNAFDSINTNKINLRIETSHKVLNPFYSKYNEVFQLSLKILNNDFASVGNTKEDFSAFLFDISLLFEHHIRKLLKQNFILFDKNKKEFTMPDGIGIRHIYPDIIIDHGLNKNGKRKISIFDVKYKNYRLDGKYKGVDRNDRFQLMSYVAAHLSEYDVLECGFIYPSKSDFKQISKQFLNICENNIPFKIYTYCVAQKDKKEFSSEQILLDKEFNDKFNHLPSKINFEE